MLADVSGKGVSAALLASTLQGMIYSQLTAGMPLTEIVTAVNRFFTDKNIGEKYATVIIARVRDNGDTRVCQLRARSAASGLWWRGQPDLHTEICPWDCCPTPSTKAITVN